MATGMITEGLGNGILTGSIHLILRSGLSSGQGSWAGPVMSVHAVVVDDSIPGIYTIDDEHN